MKNKVFLTAAVTAFLVGASAVVVAHADDSGTEIANDPAKQAAMESTPEPTDISTDVISDAPTLKPASANSTNSFQLNILDQQDAIIGMMTGSVAPGRLSKSLVGLSKDEQLSASFTDEAIATRKSLIADNYTSAQVDQQLSTYNDGLRSAITDPDEDWLYVDNRFSVTTWQGIQWTSNNGTATLIGHQSYQEPDGTWVDDPDEQWSLRFNHATGSGIYHLSSYTALPLDAGGQG